MQPINQVQKKGKKFMPNAVTGIIIYCEFVGPNNEVIIAPVIEATVSIDQSDK